MNHCSSVGCSDPSKWSGLCPSHYWQRECERLADMAERTRVAEEKLGRLYDILRSNMDPEIDKMHLEGETTSCIPCARCNSFRVVGRACAFCCYSPGPPASTEIDR